MEERMVNFYRSFYGYKFTRIFRRPHQFQNTDKFRIEYYVYTPNKLYSLVKHNSGFHKCLISTYSYGIGPLVNKSRLKENTIIDRLFLDFDITLEGELSDLQKKLNKLREYGCNHQKVRQDEIKEKLRQSLLKDSLALKAVEEAKYFAEKFKESFDNYPILFFSGFKGCHAYLFFKPVNLVNPNLTISDFASRLKKYLELDTMDLSVNMDPVTRLSRIPYSKHELTGLSVVPFTIDTPYEEIIENAVKPEIELLRLENHLSNLDSHLINNETILLENQKIRSENLLDLKPPILNSYKNLDHRIFFENLLGWPARRYDYYDMYHCPFPDHEDLNPSFTVYEKIYICFGCNRKGNYWQFLKEYNDWDDNQVNTYLKKVLGGLKV